MQSNDKKKICLVVSSLGKGGAQKSAALLSIMLSNLRYDVHIVSVLNVVEYDFKGTLFNLGELKDENDSFLGRIRRFKLFKKYLTAHNFDFIIDSRSRPTLLKELLISKLIYKPFKVIYMVHSWKLKTYFPKSRFWSKFIYKNSFKIVAVSKEIQNEIIRGIGLKNVSTIYNAVDIKTNLKQSEEVKGNEDGYALFYGRLDDEVKNVSLLINAYKMSNLPSKNIKLLIIGSGPDEKQLKSKSNNDLIDFIPFTANPFPYIKNAKFVLLTSRYEGFPMVIPESLALGTPVVSVNCKSGPKEIIKDRFNGLLVENNDEQALANAMNNFIFDDALYHECKKNTQDSIQHLSLKNIGAEWKKILKS